MKDCFKLSKFIELDQYQPINKRIKLSELLNKSFIIKKCIRYDKSKFNRPFYKLNIIINGQKYFLNTSSEIITMELDDLTKNFSQLEELNICAKLINIYGNYKLIDGDINECSNI